MMMIEEEVAKARLQRKALAARVRYHQMTYEQRMRHNQRRAEGYRRRRQEELEILSTPIECINDEILERVQKLVIRNAKKAERARLRYQRMTPQERKIYNRKRYPLKLRTFPAHDQLGEYEEVSNHMDAEQEEEEALHMKGGYEEVSHQMEHEEEAPQMEVEQEEEALQMKAEFQEEEETPQMKAGKEEVSSLQMKQEEIQPAGRYWLRSKPCLTNI